MVKRVLVIAVGVLLFLFILRQVDLRETWALLQKADLGLCLVAWGAILVMVYLKGIRWSYLLRMQGHRYPVWDSFLAYMVSLYWGNITPGRAGDFVKVFYLKEDLKLPLGMGMASVLVDRVFDLYLLLILGCLGLIVYPMPSDPRLVQMVWIFFGLLILVTFLAFNRRIGEVLLKAIFQRVLGSSLKEKTDQAFLDFHKGMEAFYRPSLLVPAALSAVSYLVFFWGCYLLARSIGLEINPFYLVFTISVVNIVSLLTFLGMGTREGALIILFELVALTREQALAFSLLLFLVGLVLFTTLCFLCSFLKPIRWKGAP